MALDVWSVRTKVMAWLVVVATVALAVAVRHGVITFSDIPHIDDWLHVMRLRVFVEGDMSWWEYVFHRHNSHPNAPNNIAFLAAYQFASMNLELVRWATLIVQTMSVGVASALFISSARSISDRLIMFGVPAIVLAGLSLSGREAYSIATGFAFAITTFCSLSAVFLLSRWLRSGGITRLLAAILFATTAALSGLHGWLAFAALAFLLLVQQNFFQRALGVAFLAAAVGVLSVNYLALGGVGGERDFGRAVTSVALLAGLPWFSPIGNRSVPAADIAIGIVVVTIASMLLAWWVRASTAARLRAAPFAALIGMGAGAILLIAIGRNHFALEQIAASRYVTVLFPGVVGLVGLACVAAEEGGWKRFAAPSLLTLAFVGWFLSAQQEIMLEPHRVINANRIREHIIRGDADVATIRRDLYVGLHYAEVVVPSAIAFMRERRLGPFRDAPRHLRDRVMPAGAPDQATTGPIDVRTLVPAGYVEPERTWVPSTFTFNIANQGEPRVLVVSGWRGPTPFEVSVSANNDLVANRTFEDSLFEMSVHLPPQSGPVTTVSIATTPSVGPDQRDQRARGFVVHSVEVRAESAPSP